MSFSKSHQRFIAGRADPFEQGSLFVAPECLDPSRQEPNGLTNRIHRQCGLRVFGDLLLIGRAYLKLRIEAILF